MIQPAVFPAVTGLMPPGEAHPALSVEGLCGSDFGAFLAIEEADIVSDGLAKQPPMPALRSQAKALPAEPDLPSLPARGKELPVALPVDLIGDPALTLPLPVPAIAALVGPIRSARSGTAAMPEPELGTVETRVATVPVQTPESAPLLDDPQSAAMPVSLVLPPQPLLPVINDPTFGQQVVLETPGQSLPRDVAGTLPFATTEPRQPPPLAPQPKATTYYSALSPVTLPILPVPAIPVAPDAASQPLPDLPNVSSAMTESGKPQLDFTLSKIAVFRAQEVATPVVSATIIQTITNEVEQARLADKTVLARPGLEPALPATFAAAAGQPLAAPPVLISNYPAMRPHDFTQLVDRLVAARDLAAPQGFQVSVQHGEFGAVQLRFQREGEGLNIAMASADPDFARAVSTAPAPVLPTLSAETPAQASSGQRFDTAAQTAAGNGSQGQSRNAASERREDRSRPAENSASVPHGERSTPRRIGIFA